MPKYRVTRRSWFADLGLVEPGVEVNWDGRPGTNLEAVDDEGKKAKEEAARLAQGVAFANQAGDQIGRAIHNAMASGFQPASSSFAAVPTVDAPDARVSKSGVVRPADQVPAGDTPGPSPSTGQELPPDTSTFVPAGVVSQPTAPADEEEAPASAPRRRRSTASEE